jgi:hypothetical protein
MHQTREEEVMRRIHKEFPWIHFEEDTHEFVCVTCNTREFIGVDAVVAGEGKAQAAKFAQEHKDCPKA